MSSIADKPTSCFVHVPKSGGTALTLYLRRTLGRDRVYHVGDDSHYQNASPETLLGRFPVVMGHFTLAQIPARLFETTFFFTFLREPVDRIISLYHFFRYGDEDHGEQSAILGEDQSLDGILDAEIGSGRCSRWSNGQTQWFSGAASDDRPAEELLPAALRNLERFDFVGVYERFAEGVERLGRLRGWPLHEPVPRFKASRNRPALEQVDPATLARIRAVNACDELLYARARELWERTKIFSAAAPTPAPPAAAPAPHGHRREHGTREISFHLVQARDQRTGRDAVVEQGNPLEVRLELYSAVSADNVNVGVRLSDAAGLEVYGITTQMLGRPVAVVAQTILSLSFAIDLVLAPGGYHVTVAVIAADEGGAVYHWIDDVTTVWCVRGGPPTFVGLVDLRARLEVGDAKGVS